MQRAECCLERTWQQKFIFRSQRLSAALWGRPRISGSPLLVFFLFTGCQWVLIGNIFAAARSNYVHHSHPPCCFFSAHFCLCFDYLQFVLSSTLSVLCPMGPPYSIDNSLCVALAVDLDSWIIRKNNNFHQYSSWCYPNVVYLHFRICCNRWEMVAVFRKEAAETLKHHHLHLSSVWWKKELSQITNTRQQGKIQMINSQGTRRRRLKHL